MEANYGALGAHHGAMDAHSGTVDAYPAAKDAHPKGMEGHPGVMEAHIEKKFTESNPTPVSAVWMEKSILLQVYVRNVITHSSYSW
jgi:hypothetical protein